MIIRLKPIEWKAGEFENSLRHTFRVLYIVFKLSVVPERSFIFHLLRPHYNNLQSLLYFYTLISLQYTEYTYYNPRSIETARKMCKICKNSNMITTSIPLPISLFISGLILLSFYTHKAAYTRTHKNAIFIIFHPFLVFISLFYSNTGNTAAASWCCCWWWCRGRREGSRQFYYIF